MGQKWWERKLKGAKIKIKWGEYIKNYATNQLVTIVCLWRETGARLGYVFFCLPSSTFNFRDWGGGGESSI